MAITDIPIFSMLRTRLDWAQTRQRLLAENVANSDTPNYQAHDLAPLSFPDPAKIATAGVPRVQLAQTEAGHFSLAEGSSQFSENKAGYDVRPTGNAVSLEEEMMKVTANQMDYQTASALYTHSLNLIKTAIGKR
ncbi:flagellar basal body rod protein FlgB [Microbacteriaceae bacterium K1510]|nr:flagellar basal body rod protein FlgB [Microbacteriaceae bacterium K1510]